MHSIESHAGCKSWPAASGSLPGGHGAGGKRGRYFKFGHLAGDEQWDMFKNYIIEYYRIYYLIFARSLCRARNLLSI